MKKGQPVYAIYSEELLADENGFLLSLDQLDQAVAQNEIARQLLDAARKKLLLWTLSKEQIEALETSRAPDSRASNPLATSPPSRLCGRHGEHGQKPPTKTAELPLSDTQF
ncbi:MAG: hypothetical protein EPO28_07040 [Saprospiraceae bacterium]|nr:MAG: hypothetical protein EPO28_07040 [Saprospiraceae bacterium]